MRSERTENAFKAEIIFRIIEFSDMVILIFSLLASG